MTNIKKKYTQIAIVISLFMGYVSSSYAIYNGIPVPNPNDYSFMVSIQIKNPQPPTTFDHWCGGSMITPTMILTAGHCVANAKDMSGAFIIRDPSTLQIMTRHNMAYTVKAIHLKPDFYYQPVLGSAGTPIGILAENDLAIIELNQPIRGERTVNLPEPNKESEYYFPGNRVLMMGYGVYDASETVSYPVLRSAWTNVIQPLEFHDFYYQGTLIEASKVNPYLYPSQFFGTYNSQYSSGSHDSGSPLLIQNRDGSYVVIGIFSMGFSVFSLPFQSDGSVMTGVPDNLTWIKQII